MAQHAVLPAMAAAALLACASRGHAVAPFVQEGTAGFVLSHIEYALSDDAEKTGACPLGMSSNVEEIFARTLEGQRREGEADADYAQRLKAGGRGLSLAPDGRDLCMHPEAGAQDPFYRTVAPGSLPAFGIDMDGLASAMNTATAPATCPHDDFSGMDDEPGIDNQFFRAVGCNHSFQSTGQSNTFATQMLTGSWGILINLKGVDDIYNDDSVEVEFLSNADPIKLSPRTYATALCHLYRRSGSAFPSGGPRPDNKWCADNTTNGCAVSLFCQQYVAGAAVERRALAGHPDGYRRVGRLSCRLHTFRRDV